MPVSTFLPGARPPRSPGSSPPMNVSSTCTVPASRSHPGRTSTDRAGLEPAAEADAVRLLGAARRP